MREKTASGVLNPWMARGLPWGLPAMASRPSWLCTLRSVPLGRFRSSSPLVFSQVTRCQAVRIAEIHSHACACGQLPVVGPLAIDLDEQDGQSPLDPDEKTGLIPQHLATKGDLKEWEQESNPDCRALAEAEAAKRAQRGVLSHLARQDVQPDVVVGKHVSQVGQEHRLQLDAGGRPVGASFREHAVVREQRHLPS